MLLDKPVKTYLMNSIEAAIKGMTSIYPNPTNQVIYGHSIPTGLDAVLYPYTCFFDDAESKVDKNRITQKTFTMVIQTWVTDESGKTIFGQMDLIDAELEKTLLNDLTIRSYALQIIPESSNKMVVIDESGSLLGLGVLESLYRVTYVHAWKNPYELPKG